MVKVLKGLLIKILIFLLLFCSLFINCFACELGKTYKDFYGKPDGYDLAVSSDGQAYYFPNGEIRKANKSGTIWEIVFFDKYDIIALPTGYTWCGMQNPPPKGREPYIIYKGHRWYPQYHGTIYVYKDGREVQ